MGGYLWEHPDVERVLMLLSLMALGKLLQGRFPGKDTNAIQTLLMTFFVPATLFKGLSSEIISCCHLMFLAGGVCFVVVKLLISIICSRAVFGISVDCEREKFRRTAMFELSTTATALSIIPFISAFLGDSYVGNAAIVNFPMKLYELLVMPILLRKVAEKTQDPSERQGSIDIRTMLKMFQDPVTCALFAGLATAFITGGRGLGALGFAGKAIDAFASAQTPILFVLLGLKLEFNSATPFFCLVLLLATQGMLMMVVSVFVYVANLGDDMAKFVILFSQGAPAVLGVAVLRSVVESGVDAYSVDFAFDLVGLAFPITSLLQCTAGLAGESYSHIAGFIGLTLVIISVALRLIFRSVFQVRDRLETETSDSMKIKELA